MISYTQREGIQLRRIPSSSPLRSSLDSSCCTASTAIYPSSYGCPDLSWLLTLAFTRANSTSHHLLDSPSPTHRVAETSITLDQGPPIVDPSGDAVTRTCETVQLHQMLHRTSRHRAGVFYKPTYAKGIEWKFINGEAHTGLTISSGHESSGVAEPPFARGTRKMNK